MKPSFHQPKNISEDQTRNPKKKILHQANARCFRVFSNGGTKVGRYVGRCVDRYFWVWSGPFITLIKCLKGHKSLGSLCSVVKSLIVSSVRPSKGQGHL